MLRMEDSEVAALTYAWQQNQDYEARNKIVLAFEPFARSCTKKFWAATGKKVPLSDLVIESLLILQRCTDSFDPSRGNKFVTYCKRSILRRLSAYLDKQRSITSGGTAEQRKNLKDVSVDDVLQGAEDLTKLDTMEDERAMEAFAASEDQDEFEYRIRFVNEAMSYLNERQRFAVIEHHSGATLEEIGRALGCSKQAADYLFKAGFAKLQKHVKTLIRQDTHDRRAKGEELRRKAG